jgi:hypothetical protein
MKLATVGVECISQYSQSKHYEVEKLVKESAEDFEKRTWRERCHYTEKGQVFIPPMQFANSLKEAAKYLNIQVKGEGKTTWTKHFEAGVLVTDPIYLPEFKDTVKGEWLLVPSLGRRGPGPRVTKCFPLIESWKGTVTYWISDDKITKDIFSQVIDASGKLIGIGRFRPRNLGFYGRFKVVDLKWESDI